MLKDLLFLNFALSDFAQVFPRANSFLYTQKRVSGTGVAAFTNSSSLLPSKVWHSLQSLLVCCACFLHIRPQGKDF